MKLRAVAVTLVASVAVVSAAAVAPAVAAENLKPFVLASQSKGDMAATVTEVEKKLTAGGFQVVGSYKPYPSATVIAVTDPEQLKVAAETPFGGYGAVDRVSVTAMPDGVQVAYTNPVYMAAAYRMAGDLSDSAKKLAAALGDQRAFGSKDGLSASDLRHYHYMFGMEYFTDQQLLASYPSQEAAVAAVEKNLAADVSGISKVYRVDIPGKQQTVFGVAMNGAKGGGTQQDDAYIMQQIDFAPIRSTAHLPYEMVVSDGKVYALSARFRIAIDFPDLSMMGSHSFMSIMGAPDAIRAALTKAAGGKSGESGQPSTVNN